jgi:hypothetical protein
MLGQIFEPVALLLLAGFALVAFIFGLIIGLVKGEGTDALMRGLEGAILAFAGGFLARTFIALILLLGERLFQNPSDNEFIGTLVGWFFFFIPKVIDLIFDIFSDSFLNPTNLLWLATITGAFGGMLDGVARTHNWRGLGWLSFPLDYTWGLSGTFNGCLLHIVNNFWGGHTSDERHGAHRYSSGFAFKPGFAFTQGAVMSSNSEAPGTALYAHENTHVWQNRIFGPFFILTYVGWMIVMLIPGFIAGAIKQGANVFVGVERWCYFNNPWEAWGYHVGHKNGASHRTAWGTLIWSDLAVIIASIFYFVSIIGATVLLIAVL